MEKGNPLVIRSAKGSILTDTDGRRYVDGVSSLWVNAHGHRHPALDRAVRRQLGRMAHTTFGRHTNRRFCWARRWWRLPRRTFNGSSIPITALLLWRWRSKWRFSIGPTGQPTARISGVGGNRSRTRWAPCRWGGISAFHKTFRPLLFKAHFALAPHCYRCPFSFGKSPLSRNFAGGTSPRVFSPLRRGITGRKPVVDGNVWAKRRKF